MASPWNPVEETEVLEAIAEVRQERYLNSNRDKDTSSTDSVCSFFEQSLSVIHNSEDCDHGHQTKGSGCTTETEILVTPYLTLSAVNANGGDRGNGASTGTEDSGGQQTHHHPNFNAPATVTSAQVYASEGQVPHSEGEAPEQQPAISITALSSHNPGSGPPALPSYYDSVNCWPTNYQSYNHYYPGYHHGPHGPGASATENQFCLQQWQQQGSYMDQSMVCSNAVDHHHRSQVVQQMHQSYSSYEQEYSMQHAWSNANFHPELMTTIQSAINHNMTPFQALGQHGLSSGEQVIVLPPCGHEPLSGIQNLRVLVFRPTYHLFQIPVSISTNNDCQYPTPGQVEEPVVHPPPPPYVEPEKYPVPVNQHGQQHLPEGGLKPIPGLQSPQPTAYPGASTPISSFRKRSAALCYESPVVCSDTSPQNETVTVSTPGTSTAGRTVRCDTTIESDGEKKVKTGKRVAILPDFSKVKASDMPDTKLLLPPKQIANCGETVYVNPKQYQRIMRRRETRDKMQAEGKLPLTRSRTYIHKSRHLHAITRNRIKNGRFGPADPSKVKIKQLPATDTS